MVAEPEAQGGVIASKLVPHRRPSGSVSRPHLLELLDGGQEQTLTLLSAPAGFGKTTVLTEWIDAGRSGTSFAWVSLDAADAEPVRLWTHVIAALARSGADAGARSLAALRSSPGQVLESVLPALFEELSAGDTPLVLILDDYHLAENPAVDEQVMFFLTYRPARVQLVISTRSDPSLGVARLRASGDLVELRAESLRFDLAELANFFEGVGVTGLTEADLLKLSERTNGWPAPLRLASLLIPENGRDHFIDTFTGESRTVVDYLTADVLDLLKPEIRDFLLQVSVLKRMNGPLCDAVIGASGSGERLAALERANLFVAIDADGAWYHQHQLFADALHLELTRTRPDLVPVLHARAAAWLASNGEVETATEHAIASGDVTLASPLVAGQVQAMVSTGRTGLTRRWLAELSWPEALRDPELAFVRAVAASLESRYDDAVTLLEVARTGPPDQRDAAGLPLGFRVDFLESIAGVNQVSRAHEAAQRAVATAPSSVWEGVALAAVGQAEYLQGHSVEATQTLRRAVSKIPDANPVLLAVAVGSLGLAEADLPEDSSHAAPLLEPVLRMLSSIGAEHTAVAAVLHLACGERERRSGDLRAADTFFSTAIYLLKDTQAGAWLALAHLLRAQVQRALGDPVAAAAGVDVADGILHRVPDPGNLRERSARLTELAKSPARVTSEYGEELTERELAVLHLAATGLEQRQIAEQLYISYNTVKSHLKTSYRKLGVSSRAAAVERLAALESHDNRGEQARSSPG
jgi:LuxR family maltose regulon positive regulatory protein